MYTEDFPVINYRFADNGLILYVHLLSEFCDDDIDHEVERWAAGENAGFRMEFTPQWIVKSIIGFLEHGDDGPVSESDRELFARLRKDMVQAIEMIDAIRYTAD